MPRLSGAAPPASLYVHFPFCVSRCHYCDFSVRCSTEPPVDAWLASVRAELGWWYRTTGWSRPASLRTTFVGGGTPSLLGADGLSRLAAVLRDWFTWKPEDFEWTAESNPSTLTEDTVRGWLSSGVTRLSIGVQAFDDRALRWLGRLHDARAASAAIARARAAGFANVNMDLIFGLPAGIERDWEREVSTAVEAGVTHVSTYGLTAEPGTPLGRRVAHGAVRMASGGRYADEYLTAAESLVKAGFVHYEVSNFALPGRECLHNWHYWDGTSYLGLGASAHSYVGGTRLWNVYRWEAYRRAVSDGGSPVEGSEETGAGESQLERLWLAFRTNRGISIDDPLGRRLRERAGELLTRWSRAGWMQMKGRRVSLTPAGWLRMDALVAAMGAAVGMERAAIDEMRK